MADNENQQNKVFGSDVAADMLRALGVPYVAINPGASFRGLHDSIVNHLDNDDPKMLLTLHEAQAVAMAHGFAKVTGKPMGVILHANVGLMNAVMAIYDAYVDRVPMLIIGATGAVDADRRRPWIEWIHTSRDQASMIRPFVKWDDQPASVPAMVESFLRAWAMTRTAPHAPTYVCLDVDIQEKECAHPGLPDVSRFDAWPATTLMVEQVKAASLLIARARRPLMLVGRHSRTDESWQERVAFAEKIGAIVICDQKVGIGFPSDHPAFVSAPAQYPDKRTFKLIDEADLVIALDWGDLNGLMRARSDKGRGVDTIIVSADERLHNGWSYDHFPFSEANLRLPVLPEIFVRTLLTSVSAKTFDWEVSPAVLPDLPSTGPVTVPTLVAAVERVRGKRSICYTRMAFGAPDALLKITGPLDLIGYDGGGGIGSTPGITVGVALALNGTGRLPVSIIGDGDLLMGSQALWTAAAQKVPCLFIVNNNASFYNDVEHQEMVAIRRGRNVENKYIGMAITDPEVSLTGLAASYGFSVFGPVGQIEDLDDVLEQAFLAAEAGGQILVDVTTLPPPPRS